VKEGRVAAEPAILKRQSGLMILSVGFCPGRNGVALGKGTSETIAPIRVEKIPVA
jgi:hypothetical protein